MDEVSGKSNRGELAEQILDRIASDGDFRRQLANNPAETLKQAGYDTNDEVSGYRMAGKGTSAGLTAGGKQSTGGGIGGSISLGGNTSGTTDPAEIYPGQITTGHEKKQKYGDPYSGTDPH
jgi:hypothetical protein